MTETPGGFPEPGATPPSGFASPAGGPPVPPPPGVLPPVTAGAPDQPAGTWGTPAPYGQPYAPPPKKKRIWLRVLLSIVGVIVLIFVATGIYLAVRPRHHLSLKDTAAGLSKTTPTGDTARFLNAFDGAIAQYNIKHFISGAYTDGANQVGVAGGDTGRFDDAQKVIDGFASGAQSSGQTLSDYPIGGGAHLKCGTISGVAAICGIADKDTVIVMFEEGADASHLAGLSSQLRVDLEK